MGGNPDNRISLCMIVRDEEANLPRLLWSALPHVDEAVILDTGSTDCTLGVIDAIRRERGNNPPIRVYQEPWEGNFSKHRNRSIAYARFPWVLALDADEELDQATAPRLRDLVKDPTASGFSLRLVNRLADGTTAFILHPRLFRRAHGIHYAGNVHNRPHLIGALLPCDVVLHHYGYALDAATMARKQRRREEMIRAWVAREPDNIAALAYLSHTLAAVRESHEEALEIGRRALALAERSGEQGVAMLPSVIYPMLVALHDKAGREPEVLALAEKAAKSVPWYPDPVVFAADAFLRMGRLPDAAAAARRFEELQVDAEQHPERFATTENMTAGKRDIAKGMGLVACMQMAREWFGGVGGGGATQENHGGQGQGEAQAEREAEAESRRAEG